MSNEIDRLMSLDPLNLSAQDLDQIIAWNRQALQAYESGAKPKKDYTPIDLVALGLIKKIPPIKRRKIT